MSTALVIALLAVAISLLVVVIASRGGPRITTIETRRPSETNDDRSDDDKSQES